MEELQQYMTKYKEEVYNYGCRNTIEKVIGSGKDEKTNDKLVTHKQKKKSQY